MATRFSISLKEARETVGVSQREIAEELGCSQPEISRWESGRYTPVFSTVKWLERRLRWTGLVDAAREDVMEKAAAKWDGT